MIVAETKPIEEIYGFIEPYNKIMVLGCGGCVSVCLSGGEKEVGVLTSALKLKRKIDGRELEVVEMTIPRQCDWEYFDLMGSRLDEVEAVVSIGCGAGVQALVKKFPDSLVYPGLNTSFLGVGEKPGVWVEYCQGCGSCVLGLTGGICPVARCSKHILNGPCGGSEKGMCEVDPKNIPCVWQLIYDRLKSIDRLDLIEKIMDMKDWSTATDGGVRRMENPEVFALEHKQQEDKEPAKG